MPYFVVLKNIIIILFLFCQQIFAIDPDAIQMIRITDVNNEQVTGAQVKVEGTNLVFYTNIRGEVYIPADLLRQHHNLSIHCISYKSKDVSVMDISSKIVLEFR
jgi:hypothetical protein